MRPGLNFIVKLVYKSSLDDSIICNEYYCQINLSNVHWSSRRHYGTICSKETSFKILWSLKNKLETGTVRGVITSHVRYLHIIDAATSNVIREEKVKQAHI